MECDTTSHKLVLSNARAQLAENKPKIFQCELEFVDLDPTLWPGKDKNRSLL